MEKTDDVVKISLLGLQNAGKTSIIKSLKHEFEEFSNLEPTKGVNRTQFEIFGQNLFFWDFGGQKVYREKYLKYEQKYFQNIHILYYVVDVQDRAVLEDSIDYFIEVIDKIKQYNPKVITNILFHKWDPPLNGEENEMEEYEKHKMQFLDKALMHVSPETPAKISETSIFRPLSIVKAISRPMFQKDNLHQRTSTLLEDFCKRHDFKFGFINTKHFFELGRYIHPNLEHKPIEKRILEFEKVHKKLIYEQPYFEKRVEKIQFMSSRFVIKGTGKFYLVLMIFGDNHGSKKKPESYEKVIIEAKNELKKLYESIGLNNFKLR